MSLKGAPPLGYLPQGFRLSRSSGGYYVNMLIRTSPTTLSRVGFSAQPIGVGAQDIELVLILGPRFDL